MGKITWAPKILRAEGLDVYEMPGWKTCETRPGFNPLGIVCHHTATGPNWLDGHVALLLRRGRTDLSGPLSQFGLERDGTWVCIAAGRCNHNGYGIWGNDSIGVEAYNDGKGEPWSKAQMDSYTIGCAAICEYMGWNIAQVRGHKETDPSRKIDPTFNMDIFRVSVDHALEEPGTPPIIRKKGDVMIYAVTDVGKSFVIMPDGSQQITEAQFWELAPSMPVIPMSNATYQVLVAGKRSVSFHDAPRT